MSILGTLPDVVLDVVVGIWMKVLDVCGGVDSVVLIALALLTVLLVWAYSRCIGLSPVGVLIFSAATALVLQRVHDELFYLPNLDIEMYGVYDDAPQFSEMRASDGEGWGHIVASDAGWFVDEHGRTALLRGVNLAGSSKLPREPDGATFRDIGNPNWHVAHRNVSFVGRPFPLEEADEHLARLRMWGLTFVRFLVTWEAIEHEGPGIYDEDYLNYVVAVIRKMREYGISCFIDPHQDVWSRFTGGDGAPGWTLEAVGFDLGAIHETAAAATHQGHGDPLVQMLWGTNYHRLAAATMFALFFAGDRVAPKTFVDGLPVQEYLQRHYLGAMAVLARALAAEPNVVGFDTLNEPSPGWVGRKALDVQELPFRLGLSLTPWEAMQLGAGFTLKGVKKYTLVWKLSGYLDVNSKGRSVWRGGPEACIWRQNGVWDVDETSGQPRLLRPGHFAPANAAEADFLNFHMRPFMRRVERAIRFPQPDLAAIYHGTPDTRAAEDRKLWQGNPEWIVFAEQHVDMVNSANTHTGSLNFENASNFALAPHYYDGMQLISKNFRPWIALDTLNEGPVLGRERVRAVHAAALRHIRSRDYKDAGPSAMKRPVLIGEIGVAFDYERVVGENDTFVPSYSNGDFRKQTLAADFSLRALEDNLLSFTWWNYSPENTNARGDQWNDEDLSIFSRDQEDLFPNKRSIHAGGRALPALVRPYAKKVCGIPVRSWFDPYSPERRFELTFDSDSFDSLQQQSSIATEVFIPHFQFPRVVGRSSGDQKLGVNVTVSDGTYELDNKAQLLRYWHDRSKSNTHSLTVTWAPAEN